MKILLLVVSLVLPACAFSPPPPPSLKVIQKKETRTVTRITGHSHLPPEDWREVARRDGSEAGERAWYRQAFPLASREKETEKRYFLRATDGSVVEVDFAEYSSVWPGKLHTAEWR